MFKILWDIKSKQFFFSDYVAIMYKVSNLFEKINLLTILRYSDFYEFQRISEFKKVLICKLVQNTKKINI